MDTKMKSSDDSVCIGPWGGVHLGESFAYNPTGLITLIAIRHGGCIDSISFQTSRGEKKCQQSFGGVGGDKTDKIGIDGPTEYLTGLDITIGEYNHQKVITSIVLNTNLTKYGPFGAISGMKFSIPVKDGFITGFHGRAGRYLNAIGVYVKADRSIQDHEIDSNIVGDNIALQRELIGPWGGKEGRPWDDGVHFAVKEIHVKFGKLVSFNSFPVLVSVQFLYEKEDGSLVSSPEYGSPPTYSPVRVKIDCSREVLIGIEGFCERSCSGNGHEQVTSLTFHTNSKKYGPYGTEIGMFFSSNLSGGEVVGFYGRSSYVLNAIGVHLKSD